MEIRNATCSLQRAHVYVFARGNRSYGLRVAFDPLATLLHRWISWPVET